MCVCVCVCICVCVCVCVCMCVCVCVCVCVYIYIYVQIYIYNYELVYIYIYIYIVKVKCVPTLLYCLEVCPLNTKNIKSLEYPTTCVLFKIFQTYSNEIIEECKRSFGVKPLSDIVAAKKLTFLQRYTGSTNTICSAIITMCI